jgi:hypothetical protein
MAFLKALFNDDPSINTAHAIAILLVLASVGWVTFLVVKNHTLPDLSGVAYLLGGSGAMNVCSKVESIVARFKKQDPPSDDAAPDLKKVI